MDENQSYFNNMNNMQPVPPTKKEKDSGKGLFFVGLVVGIGVALLAVGIGFAGLGIQNAMEQSREKLKLDEDSALNSYTIAKLQALEETINQYFFLHDVPDEDLQNGMFKGLLAALGDPYSEYYTAEELSSMMEQSQGRSITESAHMSSWTQTQDCLRSAGSLRVRLRKRQI